MIAMAFEQINYVLDCADRSPLDWRDGDFESLLDFKSKVAGVIAIAPHITDDLVGFLQLSSWRTEQSLFKPV